MGALKVKLESRIENDIFNTLQSSQNTFGAQNTSGNVER